MKATTSDFPRVCLIVRSGLHVGSALELSRAAYVIGSDPECDIVLRDPGVAPRHCRLLRDARGVTAWDIRPGCERALRPLSVRTEKTQVEADYEIGTARIALLSAAPEPVRSAAPASPARKRSRAQLAAGALLASLVLAALMIAAADQISARLRPTQADRIMQGSAALNVQGFRAVRLQRGRQGELEAIGLVANLAEKQRLRAWLASSAWRDARFKVHAADALSQQVRDTLADSSLGVRFDGRRLHIEGTTSNLAVRQRILSVADDLKDVISIDDRVAYVEAPEAVGPLPVRIRDVRSGDARYFSTDRGERYFEGAVLPDGAEVLAIEPERIRFRRNGRELVYALD